MSDDLHKLSARELGRLFPVIIVDPDPAWPALFEEEKERLSRILGENVALRIEHFGSTAVPGLAAKPTIDILLETPDGDEIILSMRKIMEKAGYQSILRKDSPPPYWMFVKGYTPNGFDGQCYHIHAAPAQHSGLWDRLYFRDYLIAYTDLAKEYEELKKALAINHKYNREDYTDAKASFVQQVTELAKKELS